MSRMQIRTKRIKIRDTPLSYQEQAILIRGFGNSDSVKYEDMIENTKYCIPRIADFERIVIGMIKKKKLMTFNKYNGNDYLVPTMKGFAVRADAIAHLVANTEEYRAKGELDER